MGFKGSHGSDEGFSTTDLLITVVTLAVLVLIHLPSRADAKSKSVSSSCLNNLRHLIAAWTSYSEDNRGELVGASNWTPPGEALA